MFLPVKLVLGLSIYMAHISIHLLIMGQAPSSVASYDQDSSTPTDSSTQPSLDSLIAEAAAYGDDDENQSLEAKAEKALECPCIADLRNGPCGTQFSDAFVCFLKSTAEEKGSDCVNPFVALQKCIKANPNAFSKDILEDEEIKNEEKPSPQYTIRPPFWSEESRTPKRST
ncbi:mitochondrial intermembrane space import and assembly protein 40 homolog isoform X1 [Primulina tabacum]|uniref:mitochondrial intermembrane space import and assembly protein 40 homolog isoform X1 n=2 Tax=Primulina tabacum TaxID=48773 RepID=UPI003F5969EC